MRTVLGFLLLPAEARPPDPKLFNLRCPHRSVRKARNPIGAPPFRLKRSPSPAFLGVLGFFFRLPPFRIFLSGGLKSYEAPIFCFSISYLIFFYRLFSRPPRQSHHCCSLTESLFVWELFVIPPGVEPPKFIRRGVFF